MACVEEGCLAHSLMCVDESCLCQHPHEPHLQKKLKGIFMRVDEAPDLLKELRNSERVFSNIFQIMTNQITKC
jgi:hypothetical protein